MSATFDRVCALVAADDWRISDHALLRLEDHAIMASELADRIATAEVVEDYPDYHAGPCVLVLQRDHMGAVHTLWGVERDHERPAVFVTAYRPDPARWMDGFRRRKT